MFKGLGLVGAVTAFSAVFVAVSLSPLGPTAVDFLCTWPSHAWAVAHQANQNLPGWPHWLLCMPSRWFMTALADHAACTIW